jgi:hypothetical protein
MKAVLDTSIGLVKLTLHREINRYESANVINAYFQKADVMQRINNSPNFKYLNVKSGMVVVVPDYPTSCFNGTAKSTKCEKGHDNLWTYLLYDDMLHRMLNKKNSLLEV